ncbi:GNAT family N-acetyltransferase [Bacillus carboniphilus]
MKITFEDIYKPGNIVAENDQYRHYHYPEMLIRYDSNFLQFKTMPSLIEFKKVENYLREFHLKNGQKHVKFVFPENKKPTGELLTHLTDKGYDIGFLELYAIDPKDFPSVREDANIHIREVTTKDLDTLLTIQYQHDLDFGIEFAKQKKGLIKRQFENQNIRQILAYYKGSPAGYVDVIISSKTAEIDGLTVAETFRNKGIGSRLQTFVMESFPEKTVILVADGEDTPKEMYKRQNYQYRGFQYEALKVF